MQTCSLSIVKSSVIIIHIPLIRRLAIWYSVHRTCLLQLLSEGWSQMNNNVRTQVPPGTFYKLGELPCSCCVQLALRQADSPCQLGSPSEPWLPTPASQNVPCIEKNALDGCLGIEREGLFQRQKAMGKIICDPWVPNRETVSKLALQFNLQTKINQICLYEKQQSQLVCFYFFPKKRLYSIS